MFGRRVYVHKVSTRISNMCIVDKDRSMATYNLIPTEAETAQEEPRLVLLDRRTGSPAVRLARGSLYDATTTYNIEIKRLTAMYQYTYVDEKSHTLTMVKLVSVFALATENWFSACACRPASVQRSFFPPVVAL